MASGMMKTLLVSALIATQATAAIATPMASGIDSNRAALGLPVDARVSSCVTPVGEATESCGAAAESSNLVGTSQTLLLALAALAAIGIGIAASHGGHHHGSAPVSP